MSDSTRTGTRCVRGPLLLCLALLAALASCTTSSSREEWVAATPANGSFSLEYPPDVLVASADSATVHLHSEVAGPTRSPFCDFRGDAAPTSRIVDFDYRFGVSDVADTSDVTRGDHPWRVGRIALGGLVGVEDRIGVEGCGQRVITLFVDARRVLTIRGMRRDELRALQESGMLDDTKALSPSEVDSLLDRLVRSVTVPDSSR